MCPREFAPPATAETAAVEPAPAPQVRTPLVVGAANDRAEAEADRVAEAVLTRLQGGSSGHPHEHDGCHGVARSATPTPAGGAEVGHDGGALSDSLSARIEGKRGSGAALPGDVRRRMESGFGRGLGDVRIHTDPDAAALSRSISARAFTTGKDIFFGQGEFSPGTAAGERVLAHELAHTQQRGTEVGRIHRWKLGTYWKSGRKPAPDDGGGQQVQTGTSGPQPQPQPQQTVTTPTPQTQAPQTKRSPIDYFRAEVDRARTMLVPPDVTSDPAVNLMVEKWVKYSTIRRAGVAKPRSAELVAIDQALATWVAGARRTPDDVTGNAQQIEAVITLIERWQKTKTVGDTRTSERNRQVFQLKTHLQGARGLFGSVSSARSRITTLEGYIKAATTATTDQAKQGWEDAANLHHMDDETGQFARRRGQLKGSDLEGKHDDQTSKYFLVSKKGDDGVILDEALDALDKIEEDIAKKKMSDARNYKMTIDPGIGPDDIRQARDSGEQNSLSGKSTMPELDNVIASGDVGTGTATREKTEDWKGHTLIYDETDVNLGVRMASLKDAVAKVEAAGVTVGPLTFFMPKFGRNITVSKGSGGCTATATSGIAAAEFVAPRFVLMSSLGVNNPQTATQEHEEESGRKQQLKFLSARLGSPDTALERTIIHELGHALHYQHARAKFYQLNFAEFAASSHGNLGDIVDREVSQYGSNSPREMIAEMFVATVTGKLQFRQLLWDMYAAFGGPPIAHTVKPG